MRRPTIFNGGNNDRRTGRDRRPKGLSDEELFLGEKGRFSRYKNRTVAEDVVIDRRKDGSDRRSGKERRARHDRRCGFDTRSEIERFLQGERRSKLDRRSRIADGYQTFKKARAFVRSLELKSMRKWRDYIGSGMKPDNIPAAPQEVYAEHGWAGWNDWLGTY